MKVRSQLPAGRWEATVSMDVPLSLKHVPDAARPSLQWAAESSSSQILEAKIVDDPHEPLWGALSLFKVVNVSKHDVSFSELLHASQKGLGRLNVSAEPWRVRQGGRENSDYRYSRAVEPCEARFVITDTRLLIKFRDVGDCTLLRDDVLLFYVDAQDVLCGILVELTETQMRDFVDACAARGCDVGIR